MSTTDKLPWSKAHVIACGCYAEGIGVGIHGPDPACVALRKELASASGEQLVRLDGEWAELLRLLRRGAVP